METEWALVADEFLTRISEMQFKLNLAPSRGHPVRFAVNSGGLCSSERFTANGSRDASRNFSSGRMVLSLEDLEEEGY